MILSGITIYRQHFVRIFVIDHILQQSYLQYLYLIAIFTAIMNTFFNKMSLHTALFVALNRLKTVVSLKQKGVSRNNAIFHNRLVLF